MPECGLPRGQRFSLVYLRSDDQLSDSLRMRRRIGAAVSERFGDDFSIYLSRKLGIPYQTFFGVPQWMEYYTKLDLRDVLDSVTIHANFLRERTAIGYPDDRQYARERLPKFFDEVREILAEERIRYTLDEQGGIHLQVDEQFQVNCAAAIQGMGNSRYAAARASLESGLSALDSAPPNGREAIRDVFGACENVFKQTFGAQRLAGHLIDNHLRPAIDNLQWNSEAAAAAELMCGSLKSWTTAAHKYRHETGRPEPHQPPLDLAVMMVSQGTSFLRWLVMIDKAIMASASEN